MNKRFHFADDELCIKTATGVDEDGCLSIVLNGYLLLKITPELKVLFSSLIDINEDRITGQLNNNLLIARFLVNKE